MNKPKFDIELVDKLTPEEVIRNSLNEIEEATQKYVIGKIEKYDGSIASYKKDNSLTGVMNSIITANTIDVQSSLGELSEEKRNTYEVFLKVKNLGHYKYRMMFVDYGAVAYPATIVLSEKISVDYSGKMTGQYSVETMKDLEDMMEGIINSDTMHSLLKSLIQEALRQETKTAN